MTEARGRAAVLRRREDMMRPSFTLGIEEEYLVIDRATRDLVPEPGEGFRADCRAALGAQVSVEMLQCQVEVGTRPQATVGAAAAELAGLRAGIAAAAEAHGYGVIAAATHPFARWRRQSHTRRARYEGFMAELGLPIRRMLICGMHVHVAIEDPDLRIELMNQAAEFLPTLLALSASSPFWEGEDTGLASYRITVGGGIPRSGPPDRLASEAEFRGVVARLVEAGCIKDASEIWWDIRPSVKFPTLEMRVTDICPRLADAAALAAAYQALLGHLYRLRRAGLARRLHPPVLIGENRWRAQRYGGAGELIDLSRGGLVAMPAAVEDLIATLAEDAGALGCRAELDGLRRIAAEGTSAERQRAVRAAARTAGASEEEALRAVIDQLAAEFLEPAEAMTSG